MKKGGLYFFLLSMTVLKAQTPFNEAPAWTVDAVWYQIFVERFRNGDLTNEQTIADVQGSWPHNYDKDWKTTKWTSNWYENSKNSDPKQFYDLDIQGRRYGGDLQGILDKLDYLEDLGINAIYINPLNDAPSLHKFDARNYRHIDINIGPDPEGDKKIMANENPIDPATWQWTSADKLFLKLIKELHKRNIKIVMDYSWNHTGIKFWAWEDILKNGKESKYAHWYEIKSFADPADPDSKLEYNGWAGVRELPEFKKVDVKNRDHEKPCEGNLQPDVKQHVFNVSKRWLDPNNDGNFEDGIDGFRLDVADQIGMDFWREYRTFVRSVNPNTLLLGEIWWEKWPDILMDPRPYLKGDVFDIVMYYHAFKPARDFFAKTEEYGGAGKLQQALAEANRDMSTKTVQGMMAMSSSHDAPRLLTAFENKNKYKYNSKPSENRDYISGKPSEETHKRAKLFLSYQFSMPGAPQIWAGDEMGMWGADDPDNRKPLWWDDMVFENETADPYKNDGASHTVSFNRELHSFYKKLISIRNENPVLRTGSLHFLYAQDDLLAFERTDNNDRIVVILNNADTSIRIPDIFDIKGKDLMGNKDIMLTKDPKKPLELAPLSALIIKEHRNQ